MKRFKSFVMAALALLVGVTYLLPAAPALAETSASLSIPPKKNYVIEPGETVDDTLTIRNLDSNSPLNLTLRVVDFTFTDDGGTPKLLLDPASEPTTWSLRPYLKLPQNVIVPAGGSKTVDMQVAIPADRGAGSLYSAIIYSSGSGEGGNVGLSASGVTLAFANIPGIVNENLQLEKFGPYEREKKSFYSFSVHEPLTMGFRLKNNGNVTEAPVGSITIKSMWGQEIKMTDLNPNNSLALIGQTRTFSSCIKAKEHDVDFQGTSASATSCISAGLWPGRYTASIELYYGQNGNMTQEITKTIAFWYMPWWFIAVVTAVLAAAFFYGRKAYLKIRGALYGPKAKSKKQSRRR